MKKMVLLASSVLTASMIASCGAEDDSKDSNLSTDYESKCGECRKEIEDHFNYCIYCGTKVGEGSFEPYENINECVYGAPCDYIIDCDECENEHIIKNSMDGYPDYCPDCGSEADVTFEESDW